MRSNNENNVSESTGGSIWQSLNSGARSKLVQLINSGMPTAMMADFLNLEPAQLAELLEVPELKQLIAQQEAAERLNSADASSKWDEVEVLALKNVLGELNSRPDPIFALKAAAVANKAIRSHKGKQQAMQQLVEGAKTITLQLNQQVVNALVNAGPAAEPTAQLATAVQNISSNSSTCGAASKVLDVFTAKDMERLARGGSEIEAYFEPVQKAESTSPAGIEMLKQVDDLIDLPSSATGAASGAVDESAIKSNM
jgi:hypothetical protein|nr:MAG TPA: hypothetical protein [Caudoviricetes sp.]